jgi:predicted RND superfamily exporter protein
MWKKFARIILQNRIIIIIIITLITGFMGYMAKNVKLDYNYISLLPKTNPYYIAYQKFKHTFGEDATMAIIGIKDSSFFTLEKFNDWKLLQDSIDKIYGVKEVLSVFNAIEIEKDSGIKKFHAKKIFPDTKINQLQFDSLVNIFKQIPFYSGLIFNDSTNVVLMAITLDKDIINTPAREKMFDNIERMADVFGEKYGTVIHYSGLPYSRTKISLLIRKELFMFVFLAMFVTAFILFMFFRSFKVVFFSMLIVGIAIVWVMGTMGIFNFEITILTGMIPPLIIVIGIPNSVYLLNKYHNEYKNHGNKIKALHTVIYKIGNATFLTNLTTALGFATFIITGNRILVEFGIIASLNILGVFLLSTTLIPIFFSFLAPPKDRHIKHLDYKLVGFFINKLVYLVLHQRKVIYAAVIIILGLGIYGITLIKTEGFIIDDIPESNAVYRDLKFLENNIGGVMPLEITIDTKKKKGVYQYTTLEKMDKFVDEIEKINDLSKPTSIIDGLKFARQAYYNNNPATYKMPSKQELAFISPYLPKKGDNSKFNIINAFVDSLSQVARISCRLNDIGTIKNVIISDSIHAIAKKYFPEPKYKVSVTGSSVVFTQGTNFLIKNLYTSLALAVFLIALIMGSMFTSLRMIIISIVPNLVPLIFTAAVMGYFNIPIKPSTVLVFSITFGIAVDSAIHFFAKYRQELFRTNGNIEESSVLSLKETGVSIIYTSGILFFGFGIFTLSQFGGTQALGLLVSTTLLIAMLSNLLFLPSLLLSLKHSVSPKALEHPLIIAYADNGDEDENNT